MGLVVDGPSAAPGRVPTLRRIASSCTSSECLLDGAEKLRGVLMAHLGIWSRKDPWAPAVLEPLITGLQARGFCFETLREHPDYRDALQARRP